VPRIPSCFWFSSWACFVDRLITEFIFDITPAWYFCSVNSSFVMSVMSFVAPETWALKSSGLFCMRELYKRFFRDKEESSGISIFCSRSGLAPGPS